MMILNCKTINISFTQGYILAILLLGAWGGKARNKYHLGVNACDSLLEAEYDFSLSHTGCYVCPNFDAKKISHNV